MARLTHTVIDARSGKKLLAGATASEFDRWYDAHSWWRQVASLEEIKPELRPAFGRRPCTTHYLVEDAD